MEKPSNRVLLKGIFLSPTFYNVEAIKRMQDEFEVRNQDVIIVTYPKSGTHWMIDIISLIYSKGDPTWVKSVPFWKRSPWIEMEYGMEMVKNKEDPRLFTSHLPIHLFPKAYFTSKAKVSSGGPRLTGKETSGFTFEHVIENFQQGNGICGDWKNHFTVTQADVFNKLYQEKMEELGTDLFPWDQC
uniref:Sulfotransferase n=1 Tax=Monodelphis domestica TaxID=13616 RepID=H9H9J3_MONDO